MNEIETKFELVKKEIADLNDQFDQLEQRILNLTNEIKNKEN